MIIIENTNDYELSIVDQKYTSADTSINSKRLPAIFNMVEFEEGDINLDFGGGRFDNVAKELEKIGVINLVYDPYNRSSSHNSSVLRSIRDNDGADSITCSNVLNVIAEYEARIAVLENCYKFLKSGRPCYITVYEGEYRIETGQTTTARYSVEENLRLCRHHN